MMFCKLPGLSFTCNSKNFDVKRKVHKQIVLENKKSFFYQVDKYKEGTVSTKFVVLYDFDLEGKVVHVPKNCILEIARGGIKNGTIYGDKTLLLNNSNLIDSSIKFTGTFISKDNVFKVADYGIHPDGNNILEKLQWLTRMVSSCGGGEIQFSSGIYILGSNTKSNKSSIRLYPNIIYKGVPSSIGKERTILKANREIVPFYAMFYTGDDKAKNIVFSDIIFDTYIGKRDSAYLDSDLRSAILLAKSDSIKIRKCKFICDICSVNTRSSHSQLDKDKGIYDVYNLTIEDCDFECHLLKDPGYLDITIMPIIGQNVVIHNNRYCIYDKEICSGHYYPNCAIEVQGRNIFIKGNTIENFSNAIDVDCADSFNLHRNIVVEGNKIYTCRGVGIWARKGTRIQGIIVKNNYLCLQKETCFRWPNSRNAICFVSHTNVSHDAHYKDIYIEGNDIKVEKNFYTSLSEKDWKRNNKWALDLGYTFDEYYSMIDVGGQSASRDNIVIKGNIFNEIAFPAVYVGGKNISNNYFIVKNLFNNCSVFSNTICLADSISQITIKDNIWKNTSVSIKDFSHLKFIKYKRSTSNNKSNNTPALLQSHRSNMEIKNNKAILKRHSASISNGFVYE